MTGPGLERCPSCQAPHSPDEAFCWMCHRKFWDARSKPARGAVPASAPASPADAPASAPLPAPAAPAVSDGRWTQPILIGAFILILAGLVTGGGPGSSLLWLGLVPAFFVTALSGFRQPKSMPESGLERVQWVLGKFASALAIMIIAAMAVSFALFAVCAAIMLALKAH